MTVRGVPVRLRFGQALAPLQSRPVILRDRLLLEGEYARVQRCGDGRAGAGHDVARAAALRGRFAHGLRRVRPSPGALRLEDERRRAACGDRDEPYAPGELERPLLPELSVAAAV